MDRDREHISQGQRPLDQPAGEGEYALLAKALTAARNGDPLPEPSAELRQRVEARLTELEVQPKEKAMNTKVNARGKLRFWIGGGLAVVLAAIGVVLCWPGAVQLLSGNSRSVASNQLKTVPPKNSNERMGSTTIEGDSSESVLSGITEFTSPTDDYSDPQGSGSGSAKIVRMSEQEAANPQAKMEGMKKYQGKTQSATTRSSPEGENKTHFYDSAVSDPLASSSNAPVTTDGALAHGVNGGRASGGVGGPGMGYGGGVVPPGAGGMPGVPGAGGSGGYSRFYHEGPGGAGGAEGIPSGTVPGGGGYGGARKGQSVSGIADLKDTYRIPGGSGVPGASPDIAGKPPTSGPPGRYSGIQTEVTLERGKEDAYNRAFPLGLSGENGEQYNAIVENDFLAPTHAPLSTFSIDVDTASYSNVRRFLTAGQLPPANAVRIEELVNYFSYAYEQPKGREPFAVNMETAECPWNPGHVLLRVGLKGKEVARKERPPSNLVFLLDVSGSMADENKLPLLKTTMTMLVSELTEADRVSIVTYAGEAGLKLGPTSGDQKEKILDVINSLSAGGSTNGSAGIEMAYQQAAANFHKEWTNRVILATDGDLNVGVTSDEALVTMIKEKAAGGTFLTILGFGEGNLKDGKLEQIADNGNGMYAYIDSVREGRKVLVEQMTGSLVTIAKDVKIQIEFNPAQIQYYRLLGYENRVMAAADFNNDKKDAGEIGAGHTVTALYELVPIGPAAGDEKPRPEVEPLKYQKAGVLTQTATPAAGGEAKALTEAAASGELLTLKLRYKEPDGIESRLIEFPLKERGGRFNSASQDFQFAAAVASFGMILRGSKYRGSSNPSAVAEIAAGSLGSDANGLRAEFVDLVRRAERLGVK